MEFKVCPKCQAEYFEHVSVCKDCEAPLVEAAEAKIAAEKEKVEADLRAKAKSVCVFKTTDPTKLLTAKNFLESAGISYSVAGEGTPHLFGIGTVGTGFNIITGQIRIFVLETDSESAREVLKELM